MCCTLFTVHLEKSGYLLRFLNAIFMFIVRNSQKSNLLCFILNRVSIEQNNLLPTIIIPIAQERQVCYASLIP